MNHDERIRLRSSSVLNIVHPRPSLPTDRISRPIRHGRRLGSRGSQRNPPSGGKFSRSEVDLRLPSSRHSSAYPPRFGSVVRKEVRDTRLSLGLLIAQSWFLSASAIEYYSGPNVEGLLVVNLDGSEHATSSIAELPPPEYSRLEPGLAWIPFTWSTVPSILSYLSWNTLRSFVYLFPCWRWTKCTSSLEWIYSTTAACSLPDIC